MCDNNTVKTRHINRSDFLKKTWLSRLFLEILINFVANKKNCFLLKILICLSSKIDTNITTENLVTGNPVYFNFCWKNYFYRHKSVSKGPKKCLSSVLSSMQKLRFLKKQTMQVKVKPSFFNVDRAGITGFIYQ